MPTRKRRGFTLIELIIAVAIVAILAAIAFPSYQNSVRKGRRSEAIAELLRLQILQEKWRAQNPTYATTIANLGDPPSGSVTNYYTFGIENVTATTYTLKATATSTGGQAKDEQGGVDCTPLTINESGTRLPTNCWR